MNSSRHSKSNSDFIIKQVKSQNQTRNTFKNNSSSELNKMRAIQTFAYAVGIIGAASGIILNYLHMCSFIAMWTIFIVSGMIIFVAQQFYISRTPSLTRQEVNSNRDNHNY